MHCRCNKRFMRFTAAFSRLLVLLSSVLLWLIFALCSNRHRVNETLILICNWLERLLLRDYSYISMRSSHDCSVIVVRSMYHGKLNLLWHERVGSAGTPSTGVYIQTTSKKWLESLFKIDFYSNTFQLNMMVHMQLVQFWGECNSWTIKYTMWFWKWCLRLNCSISTIHEVHISVVFELKCYRK